VYLNDDELASNDFAQFEVNDGNECYGNYSVRAVDP
jgi:hypothetical protein